MKYICEKCGMTITSKKQLQPCLRCRKNPFAEREKKPQKSNFEPTPKKKRKVLYWQQENAQIHGAEVDMDMIAEMNRHDEV